MSGPGPGQCGQDAPVCWPHCELACISDLSRQKGEGGLQTRQLVERHLFYSGKDALLYKLLLYSPSGCQPAKGKETERRWLGMDVMLAKTGPRQISWFFPVMSRLVCLPHQQCFENIHRGTLSSSFSPSWKLQVDAGE